MWPPNKCLFILEKNVVEDSVKGLTEVQLVDIQNSYLLQLTDVVAPLQEATDNDEMTTHLWRRSS